MWTAQLIWEQFIWNTILTEIQQAKQTIKGPGSKSNPQKKYKRENNSQVIGN